MLSSPLTVRMPESFPRSIIGNMKKIGILTSGGDAPGMNAAIRAAVREGIARGAEIIGILRGFDGLICGEFQPMGLSSVSDIIQRGGTILLTARSDRFRTGEGQREAFVQVQQAGLEGLVLIGGDGTFRGAMALEELGIPTLGVPGSIDDDLGGTDHTIGFDTAVNTALVAIDKIRDTATSHERSFVVEVMGRTAGYIALMAGLAGGAEYILIPEVPYQIEELALANQRAHSRGKRHFIVILAEGVTGAYQLAREMFERTGVEVKVSVLGYIQRGGNPSAFDRYMASRLGAAAVGNLLDGLRGQMVGLVQDQVVLTDYQVAIAQRKPIDRNLYELSKILGL
jgi:6-phosphofructokinase 1